MDGVVESSASWGDYDNDGDLDVVLTGFDFEYGSELAIIYNNSAGVFTNIGASLTQYTMEHLFGVTMTMMVIWTFLLLEPTVVVLQCRLSIRIMQALSRTFLPDFKASIMQVRTGVTMIMMEIWTWLFKVYMMADQFSPQPRFMKMMAEFSPI